MTPPPIASITLFYLPLPSAGDGGARPLCRLRAPSPTAISTKSATHRLVPTIATHACLEELRCTVGASGNPHSAR